MWIVHQRFICVDMNGKVSQGNAWINQELNAKKKFQLVAGVAELQE